MKQLLVMGLFLATLLVGCVNSPSTLAPGVQMIKETDAQPHDAMEDGNAMMDDHMADSGDAMASDSGAMMGAQVKYLPFSLAAYDQAKTEGKTIFLEFYANWCPICAAQAPALTAGIESLHSDKLVAFRVNYKDSDTDSDEQALAKKFNITYQHTHLIVDADEKELFRSQESWTQEQTKEKIGAFA